VSGVEALVYIVDDDDAVRLALRDLLESVGLNVKAYASGEEFLQSWNPDASQCCLLLDVRLHGKNGLDFQRELTAAQIDIPIVFITGHGDIPMTVQAMKAGALDFLTKPFRDQDLLDAIHRALDFARKNQSDRALGAELRQRFAELTPRECEVMELVIRGEPNKQIAASLGASEATVKIHRSRVMRKMQAGSLPDLVRIAQRIGPISPK
jgi:FixJ family two-component response regulator